jgi:hypothetical protein
MATKTTVTFGPKDVARAVSKAVGRPFDAKRVRGWVRDNVPAFDDDGYTAHIYSRAVYDRIVAGMVARAKSGRSTAASTGRTRNVSGSRPRKSKPATVSRALRVSEPLGEPKSAPVARVSPATVTATKTAPTVTKAAPDAS